MSRINRSKPFLLAAMLVGFGGAAFGQVTGVKNIPGDYATMAAAFADLNAVGVGPGGATIQVAAGYTETASNLKLAYTINPSSESRPLTFIKNGAGANPLITAGVGTGTLDGIILLEGADFVTFNGIDVQENVANVTTTTQMEWGYALLKSSATNGSQYNTIKNCTVTLNQANAASVGIYLANHTSASATGLTVSAFSGTSSYNKFHNNTVQNAYNGISLSGYAAPAPYDLQDQGNEIGVDGISTRRSQVVQFGGGATQANGISTLQQNRVKIFKTYINNNGGLTSTGLLYGIFLGTAINSDVDIYADTLTLTSSTTTSNLFAINDASGATGAGNTHNIYDNVVDGCSLPSATSAAFRGISVSGTVTYKNIYNNKVTNNNLPGTGEFAGIYDNGSSGTLVLATNVYNNVVSNNTKSGTAGNFYCLYLSASSNTLNVYGNTMASNSAASTSGVVNGYYNFAVGMNENVYNNTISGLTGGTGEVIGLVIRSGSGPTNKQIYGNTLSGITGNAAGAPVGGIWVDYGTITNVYNNKVFNLTNNTASGPTPAVYGLNIGANTNVDMNVYNNFISDLKAPSASNAQAIYGIWAQGSTSTVAKLYHNTVHLNAASVGANFGTAAVFMSTASALSIDLRNNIFVDNSTPAGTGLARALARSSTTITNYSLLSGNNCLYAGTPAANRLIYSDGTAADQTIQAFKNRVSPREQASFSELPPFVSVGSNDFHLLAGSPTQCEQGGGALPAVTLDFDGVARSATFPDCGADEYGGNFSDLASPNIQYTLLTNSGVSAARTITSWATISDPSGINTTAGTMPRIYYKRAADANTFVDNTSATNGWKFTEATTSVSPFSFNIDYTRLFGGSVVAGDVIQYFVTAQDLFSTPRVGRNSGGFTAEPASVNLAAAQFPLNNTINQYTIVSNVYSGVVNVGPAETVTSLTNAGGIFALINAGALSGNLTIRITGDLTAETGTNALNQWAEQGVGNYTVTIEPSAGVTRLIAGSSGASALVRLDGADRVTIDGRFGGSGSFLTFRNTSNTAPTIGLINDAQNNTFRNLIVESGNTSTSTTAGGAFLIGTGLATGTGNDNNTITGCEIRDRSDVAGTPAMGINIVGTNTAIPGFNSNCTISNNNIHDWFLANSTLQFGLNIGVGNREHTITGNSFYQTATRTQTTAGAVTRAININFSSSVNNTGGYVITDNFIGGTAPGATGGDMTYTVSGVNINQSFSAISVAAGMLPNSIQNNIIRKIDYTTHTPGAGASVLSLLFVGQGYHNVGTVTGNVIGAATGNDIIKVTVNAGGAGTAFLTGIFASATNGSFNINNNILGGISIGGNATTTVIPQYIQLQGTPSSTVTFNNNLVGSTTTANSVRVTSTLPPVITFGIRSVITTGADVTISGNTIQNVSDASPSTGTIDFAILATSTVGGKGTFTITNNIVRDFSGSAAPSTPGFTVYGISLQNISGIDHVVSGNTLSAIANSNTSALASGYTVGIQSQSSSAGGTISKNRIYDLRNSNAGAAPGVVGMYFSSGDQWTVSNNMISVTNGAITTPILVGGIVDAGSGGAMNYYYNTCYVGGTSASGATNSYAFIRQANAKVTLKNNLLYNERSGGTGFHYAIGNVATTPAENWNASNNNFLISADATRLGEWGTGVGQTLAAWKTSSGGDALTRSSLNTAMPSASIFASTATGDLKINTGYYLTPTYLESRGTIIAGISDDREGDARPGPAGSVNGGGTAPDIGADEFDGTPANYDAADFALLLPDTTGCHGAADSVVVQIKNTGNLILDFAATPITVNAAVTGPNPATFGPVVINTGTLAIGATQNVVMSSSYNMTAVGTYGFTSSISMADDDVSVNNTLTPVDILISGGTASATPNPICEGDTTTLSVVGYTNGGTIQWQDSTASSTWTDIGGATTTPYDVVPAVGTTYYRAVICGLHASTVTSVVVNANPIVDLGPDTATCTTAIVLDAGNPGASYLWNTSGSSQTEAVSSPGTYSVIVTDGIGCVGYDTIVVGTAPSPIVDLGTDTTYCAGSLTLDAGNPGATYLWSSSGTLQTEVFTSTGTFYVDVTDALGCVGSDTIVVTAGTIPTVSLGADTAQCGGTIDLDAGNPGSTFDWSTTETTQVITVSTSGTYTVTVMNPGAGCEATDDIVVTINSAPVVTFDYPDDTICKELGIVTLTGESPSGGIWSGAGVSGNTFDPNVAGVGTHTLTYTYTDSVTGCEGVATDIVFVDICIGIDPQSQFGVSLYPNPNNGLFVLAVEGLSGEAVNAEIWNMEGKQVWTDSQATVSGAYHADIDLTQFSKGVYMVKLVVGDNVRTLRVVTQ
jgi:hypothetical protein